MTRDDAYQALSDLINRGFLSTGVSLDGKILVFKTINEREYYNIQSLAGPKDSDRAYRFNIWFLVYSLLIFDGEYVLADRDQRAREIYGFFAGLPFKLCDAVFSELTALRDLSYDALKYIEGYTYTTGSRAKWEVLCGKIPNQDEFTGINGTGRLGLNAHQESWIHINRVLDEEEKYNHDFSLALMIASSQNPKGAKQLRARHDANMQETVDRRKRLAIEGFIETKKQWRPDGWAAPVETAEELVAELNRQMSGVKDKHDEFIERYIQRLKDRATAQTAAIKQRVEEARKLYGDLPALDGEQRPVSPQEIEKILAQQKANPGVVRVLEETAVSPEDKTRFLNKIGTRVLTARK